LQQLSNSKTRSSWNQFTCIAKRQYQTSRSNRTRPASAAWTIIFIWREV